MKKKESLVRKKKPLVRKIFRKYFPHQIKEIFSAQTKERNILIISPMLERFLRQWSEGAGGVETGGVLGTKVFARKYPRTLEGGAFDGIEVFV